MAYLIHSVNVDLAPRPQRKTALQNHTWSCRPFFVEFDGESPRSFEQEHGQTDGQKWPKNLRWRRHGRYYVTGARRKNSRLRNGLEYWPDIIDLQQQVIYELIPAEDEHFESLTWPCMIARWHHWQHKRSHVPVFSPSARPSSCLNFNLGLSQSDSTKKNPSDQSLWFLSAVFL